MAILGWFRGAMVLGQGLVALIIASLLAKPFGILGKPIAKALGAPELLAPIAGVLLAGLFIFCLVLLGVWAKTRGQEQTDKPSWDKPLGAAVGGVWGLFLVLFVFTGFNSIARADRAMREANAVSLLRTQARQKAEQKAIRKLEPDRELYAEEEFERRKDVLIVKSMKKFRPKPEEVAELVEPGALDPFLEDLRNFPFENTINNFSAVDEKSEKLLRDLTIVVSDPVLFARFQREETVRELAEDATVQALANDQEIADAIRSKRFRDLLDHPKLVKAARSSVVREKFSNVDMEAILDGVLKGG